MPNEDRDYDFSKANPPTEAPPRISKKEVNLEAARIIAEEAQRLKNMDFDL